ncbi:MAG TPA: sulfite exporter TauE/SafE family protein [Burkholderiales bacterium]|nr:sulfite exporter TauE/SafE family protein [Burkholderiales bacterium]
MIPAVFTAYPPAFYAVAVFGILVTGMFKGGFGGGPGGIAVALMAMFISPADAAAILLPILCAMDVFSIMVYRQTWSRDQIKRLIAPALTGILLGALAFRTVPIEWVRLLIGVIAVAFTLNRWFNIAQRLGAKASKPGLGMAFVCAATSGFTSTLANAGGPPLFVYLLPQKLDKTVFVGTCVVFFTIVNYTKLVPFYLLGQLSASNLGMSLLLSPLAPLGIWLGLRIERWIPERPFYAVSYAILFATGCKLIYDGIAPH